MDQGGFDPDRHFPVLDAAWDAALASEAVQEIVADAAAHLRLGALWAAHPQDDGVQDDAACLYFGGAGAVWALDHLARQGHGSNLDLPGLLHVLWDKHPAEAERWGDYGSLPSLLMGDLGLLLLNLRLAPDIGRANILQARIEDSLSQPVRELMWGLPGAMVACLDAHASTGEARWESLFQAAASRLIGDLRDSSWGPIWVQSLYGREVPWLGPVHGYAGNLAPLLRGWNWLSDGQRATITASMQAVLPATAQRGPLGTTWPAIAGQDKPARLLQHCHGAPGMVTTLAAGPVRSPELDRLWREAAEITWHAGPLRKGSNLCHGTGGNGYALLRMWEHTGEAIWLDRARAFATTAIQQCRDARRALGRGRFTLWTGDLGLAVYVQACIGRRSDFPTVDL